MNEPRNPYAPSTVPLEIGGGTGLPAGEIEYAGFWIRWGAAILDFLILLPLVILSYVGLAWSRLFYLYFLVPALAINAFYFIYLVIANDGTPGKRILKMRITMAEGARVTPKAAILRNIVEFALSVGSGLGLALASLRVTDAQYDPLPYLAKIQLLQGNSPGWVQAVTYFSFAWYALGAIVLISSRRRRTLHDFIAGTVVIRER